MKKKLRVGLTGNVGSGKTLVAREFAKKGINVIDADKVARALTNKIDIRKKLVDRFSNSILLPNQLLNRRKLLQIIVDDPEKKKWIEDYLHPLIFKHVDQLLAKANSCYVVIAMPLLLECGYQTHVDRICLVTAEESIKIKRICARDGVTSKFAKRLLNTQMPPGKSMPLADDVITNNGSLNELYEKIDQLHQLYLKLASERV
jgi:dephospho-CoA kinase